MSAFETALLCGVIVAALVSYNRPRALLWLALGAADYLFTSAWADLRFSLHPFITAMTDATVCIVIYVVCKWRGGQRWELGVYAAFWLSVGVGFLKLSGYLDTGNASATLYPLLLEAANWLAILSIFASGTLRLVDVWVFNLDGAGHNRGFLHRLVNSVYAPSRISPAGFFAGWLPPTQS